VLAWERSLIDPVGGILGAVVYAAVAAGVHEGLAYQLGEFEVPHGSRTGDPIGFSWKGTGSSDQKPEEVLS
jgi:hypothetical protein